MIRYTNGENLVYVDKEERFIYEVSVNIWYKGLYSMYKNTLYISKKYIPNIIESYFLTKYIEIFTTLHSAPISWLNKNNYILYVKPEKKKRIKNGIKKNMLAE